MYYKLCVYVNGQYATNAMLSSMVLHEHVRLAQSALGVNAQKSAAKFTSNGEYIDEQLLVHVLFLFGMYFFLIIKV